MFSTKAGPYCGCEITSRKAYKTINPFKGARSCPRLCSPQLIAIRNNHLTYFTQEAFSCHASGIFVVQKLYHRQMNEKKLFHPLLEPLPAFDTTTPPPPNSLKSYRRINRRCGITNSMLSQVVVYRTAVVDLKRQTSLLQHNH